MTSNQAMQPRRWVVTLTCLFMFGAAASAAAAAPAQEASARLGELQGTWRCDGRFERSGKPISATLTFDWNPASAALVVHHDDRDGGPYRSLEIWSPSSGKLGWQAAVVDAYSGMQRFSSEGWRDEALAWTRDDPGAPVERFTYRLQTSDRMTVVWETGTAADALRVGDHVGQSSQ